MIRIVVPRVALPALALLAWGCLLPFLTKVDALLLSVPAGVLPHIYGTAFLLLLPLALVLLALQASVDLALRWGADRTGNASLAVAGDILARLGFFLILAAGAKPLLVGWAGSYGLDLSRWPWRWLVPGAAVLLSAAPAAVLQNSVGPAKAIGLFGLLTVPFAFIDPPSSELPTVARPVARPNIVLVTLDALSARQMSLHGAPLPTTPAIDRFAAGALVFDRAYAGANFTTAGINTILTGEYPSQHRSLQLLSPARPAARMRSIPALLKAAGYRTGYVVSNPHAGPGRNGFAPYFDGGQADAYTGRRSLCEDHWTIWLPYNCYPENPFVDRAVAYLTRFGHGNREYDPAPLLDHARSFMAAGRQPFFLWVHFYQPHDPYAASAPWLGRFDPSAQARDAASSIPLYGFNAAAQGDARTRLLEARYRESLASADDAVGRLVQLIDRYAGDNTAVILTSDHGESFRDGWGGHAGRLLNDDVIHIPLIVRMPGKDAHARIDTIASQTDILPMVGALLRGSDARAIATLVAARRRVAPAFSMTFIDAPHLGALDRGSIAAIGDQGRYVRYPGGFHTPAGLLREEATGRGTAALARAVDAHLRRWGSPAPSR